MSSRPAPLTDPDCDCRGLPFMPLEVARFRDSDTVMLATGDEFKAAVLLWISAWLQVPAASLPDDDRILAKLSTYPMDEWLALRDVALRGFVKCSDGRLYHSVIADLAVSAFVKRKDQTEKANTRWAKERARKAAAQSELEAAEEPQECNGIATADSPAMQSKGTLEVKEVSDANASSGVSAEPKPPAHDEIRTAFEGWNALAERIGLPKARKLDPARRRAIRCRLADGGLDAWRQALDAIERSPLCRGENDRGWRADLDFICQPKSWRKLLEGSYADSSEAVVAFRPPRAVVDDDFAARQLARLKAAQ